MDVKAILINMNEGSKPSREYEPIGLIIPRIN